VKDIHVSGTLKFIMKPLLETVPPFGAVLLSFTEAVSTDLFETSQLPSVCQLIHRLVE
jgi:hypothetical protein